MNIDVFFIVTNHNEVKLKFLSMTDNYWPSITFRPLFKLHTHTHMYVYIYTKLYISIKYWTAHTNPTLGKPKISIYFLTDVNSQIVL